jgi:hypothetical protein
MHRIVISNKTGTPSAPADGLVSDIGNDAADPCHLMGLALLALPSEQGFCESRATGERETDRKLGRVEDDGPPLYYEVRSAGSVNR